MFLQFVCSRKRQKEHWIDPTATRYMTFWRYSAGPKLECNEISQRARYCLGMGLIFLFRWSSHRWHKYAIHLFLFSAGGSKISSRTTMKLSFCLVNALISLLLHQSTNACDCIESPTATSSLQNEDIDYVFRGYVTRQIGMGTVDINEPKYYTVRVWKVYKGCTFSNATIVLTTAGNSALCGISIALNKNYVFSGKSTLPLPKVIQKAKVRNPNIFAKEMVRVANCDFNMELLSLPSSDKFSLHTSKRVCAKQV